MLSWSYQAALQPTPAVAESVFSAESVLIHKPTPHTHARTHIDLHSRHDLNQGLKPAATSMRQWGWRRRCTLPCRSRRCRRRRWPVARPATARPPRSRTCGRTPGQSAGTRSAARRRRSWLQGWHLPAAAAVGRSLGWRVRVGSEV